MYKYIYTITKILQDDFGVRKDFDQADKISDLFDEPFNEIAWILTLSRLELIYGFEIPDELYDRTDITLEQFASELSQLQKLKSCCIS
jgi:hypothetical protein